MATLIINIWESKCSACGGGAVIEEESHHTRLPGYSQDSERKGCGAQFDSVSSDYEGMEDIVRRRRPDLRYIKPWEFFRNAE